MTASDAPTPTTIAHRGFAGVAPENTVGAARHAVDAGAELIEVDVRPTSDGEVVVFHDDRLAGRDGGPTDRSGLVRETPWAVVREAEVLDSGETVPRLDDLLDALPPTVGVNVELKSPGVGDRRFGEKLTGDALDAAIDRWYEFVRSVLAVTDAADNPVLFSSFSEGALAATRAIDDEARLAPLVGTDVDAGLAIARAYDCEAIHPSLDAVLGSGTTSSEDTAQEASLVRQAHDEGLDVNVYTVQTWHEARRLAAAGVDGLVADYPNLLAFARAES